MNVGQLMTDEVQSCLADDSLNFAAWAMWERDCGCVPVVDPDRKVVGMITDRDIAMAALMQGTSLRQIPVSTAMSQSVATVQQEQSIEDAEAIMRDHQVRRLPVTDADGHLLGVLSLNDIVRAGVDGAAGKRPKSDGILTTLAAISAERKETPSSDE